MEITDAVNKCPFCKTPKILGCSCSLEMLTDRIEKLIKALEKPIPIGVQPFHKNLLHKDFSENGYFWALIERLTVKRNTRLLGSSYASNLMYLCNSAYNEINNPTIKNVINGLEHNMRDLLQNVYDPTWEQISKICNNFLTFLDLYWKYSNLW